MSGTVVHVITGLQTGGAETMLAKLLSRAGSSPFRPLVVSLTGRGPVADQIEALGIPVSTLSGRGGLPDPRLVARLVRLLRWARPAVVQGWLYHGNLFASLAAPAAGRPPVAWALHQSNLSPTVNKRATLLAARAGALLSLRAPAAIVCCAESARRAHVAFGYAPERMVVIPNGFDLTLFRPDPAARASVRAELGLAPEAPLVGLVARWDPQKDHRTFVRAAAEVATVRPDVHFALCGGGVDRQNAELGDWITAAGIADRCHLLGRRADVARLQASFDVAVSSSLGEAFPLAVGEAMACAVPCAVTDVGDSAIIVGETGRVVPPADARSLGGAIIELLGLDPAARAALGLGARARIAAQYDLPDIARRYDALYDRLATGAETQPCAD